MKYWITIFGLCLAQMAVATDTTRPAFHRGVYALHEQQIAKHTIRTEEKTGDYKGTAAKGYRYRVTSYFDAAAGRLLSRIQRDADVPEAIHIAEVNIYDAEGRVVRDFFSSAPPWRPTQPSHAFINLHQYNGKLHSWRQFDLEGQVNYEFCEGELDGKRVNISLNWGETDRKTAATPEYRACFAGISNDWGPYLTPH